MFRQLLLTHRKFLRANLYPRYAASSSDTGVELSLNDFHQVSDDKLEELSVKLDGVLEARYDRGADVSLDNGVLTVSVDSKTTYVINKQTPNRQIWLSSPVSGPMRFDFDSGKWINKRGNVELNSLLSDELTRLLKEPVKIE